MVLRKMNKFVGAKRSWSAATRATMVALALESWMRVCRILNQVVAAGPKMANGAGRSAIISKRLRKVRQGGGGHSDTGETRAGKEKKKKEPQG